MQGFEFRVFCELVFDSLFLYVLRIGVQKGYADTLLSQISARIENMGPEMLSSDFLSNDY